MSSGGSCRSAEMRMAASPRAWLRPATHATNDPKFRESLIAVVRGSRRACSSSTVHESSREPSSTKTNSNSGPAATFANAAKRSGRLSALWKTGTTIETLGMELADGGRDRVRLRVGQVREHGQAHQAAGGGLRDRERS